MYLIVFIILNSCTYSIHVFIILEFMYLLFEYMYLLFLTIKLFLCFLLLFRDMSCYIHFMTLMIFIYNPKELKLSSRK